MIRTTNCCYCFNIKAGIYLIGISHLFYLGGFALEDHLYHALINLVAATAFIAMIYKDTEFTRMVFYVTYQTYVVALVIMEIYFNYYPQDYFADRLDARFAKDCRKIAN